MFSKLVRIIFFCFIAICAFETGWTSSELKVLDQPEILAYAEQNLPLKGVLKDNGRGFIYLKVDDNFIHQLWPMLEMEGLQAPDYFRSTTAPGAHISVFYEEETNNIPQIAELGRPFTFTPERVSSFFLRDDEELFLIQVNSPELEALRVHYGLSPFFKGS